MNLINRKMKLFCVSNLMISFVCGSFVGDVYYDKPMETEGQELVASSENDPLSLLRGEVNKRIEVIDVPNVEELSSVVKNTKKAAKKTTNVVTKKEVLKTTAYAPAKYDEVTGSAVVEYAKRYLGLRYNSGFSLTTGTDCSGFTKLIYREFGITLSRSASGQAKNGTYVRKGDLQKGDLVFYNKGSGGITHVAMYIGNGQVIHESNHRDGVKISSVNMMHYVTARRVINETAIKIVNDKEQNNSSQGENNSETLTDNKEIGTNTTETTGNTTEVVSTDSTGNASETVPTNITENTTETVIEHKPEDNPSSTPTASDNVVTDKPQEEKVEKIMDSQDDKIEE